MLITPKSRWLTWLLWMPLCGLLGWPRPALGQFAEQNPTQLIVNVYIGALTNRAPRDIVVELQNGFGGLQGTGRTDGSGTARFSTKTGVHRIRVYGPGVQEYSGEFTIEPVEVSHVEQIVLKADARSLPSSTRGVTGGSVDITRLRVPEKARKEFEKGSLQLNKKDWKKAKEHFDAAIALYADYDVAYNGLGAALMETGDQQGARTAFENAIRVNDSFAEAYRNLARMALAEKNYQEADVLLTKSLSSDPLNAWALTYAARSELELRKFDDAIAHARKAHEVAHPGLASVHIVAALALEAKQEPKLAVEEYRAYLKEEPAGPAAARAKQSIVRLGGT